MGNALLLLNVLVPLLQQANQIGALLAKAQAEGRDVTDAELDTLVAGDDAAKAALAAAIAKARATPPA
jgi:hypothetical protein